MAGKNVMEFTSANWQTEVLQSNIPVVVDFWAVWCGPCRLISPTIDQLAADYAGRIKVGKVNVDDEQDLAAQYRVTSIPQVFIFKDGQLKQQIPGANPPRTYQAAVESALGS